LNAGKGYTRATDCLQVAPKCEGNTLQAKVISDQKSFSGNDSYDRAEAFVDAHPDYWIVGTSQVVSPVQFEKLGHYELIHQSPNTVSTQQQGNTSEVEIFEYSPQK